jgi:hypothetical protein
MRTTLLAIALATAIAPVAATADDEADAHRLKITLAYLSSDGHNAPACKHLAHAMQSNDHTTKVAAIAIDCADAVKTGGNSSLDAYAFPMNVAVNVCTENDWSGDTCSGLRVLYDAAGGK